MDENDKPLFKVYDDLKFKTRNKEQQRAQALKEGYEKTRKTAMVRQFSKSAREGPLALDITSQHSPIHWPMRS